MGVFLFPQHLKFVFFFFFSSPTTQPRVNERFIHHQQIPSLSLKVMSQFLCLYSVQHGASAKHRPHCRGWPDLIRLPQGLQLKSFACCTNVVTPDSSAQEEASGRGAVLPGLLSLLSPMLSRQSTLSDFVIRENCWLETELRHQTSLCTHHPSTIFTIF